MSRLPDTLIDWAALVQKSWGKDWSTPDYGYEFSNGRRFLDTLYENFSTDDDMIYWTQAEAYGASPSASAVTNANAIQAALNQKGLVTLTTPGVYNITSTGSLTEILKIYSDTLFQLSPGVTIKGPSSPTTCLPLITNSNWRSNKVSISTMTSSTSSAPYVTTVTVATSTAHGYAANDYVQVKGDTTGYYNGIWKVYSAPTSTSFTFLMFGVAPTPPAAAGTLIAYAANANFSIEGGTFDSNLNIADGATLGELGRMGSIFNKCGDYTIRTTFNNAGKYGIYYCNSFKAVFDIGSVKGPSSAIQCNGPVEKIHMSGAFFHSGDDIFPLVTDNLGYTQYDLKDADGTKNSDGNIADVIIEDLVIERGGSRTLMLAANAGFSIKRVTMRNMQRSSSLAGLYVFLETQAGETGNFEDILIDGLYGNYSTSSNPVISAANTSTATQNITNLIVRNIGVHGGEVDGTPFAFASGVVSFGNAAANVNGLTIDGVDLDGDLTNSGSSGVQLLGFGGGGGVHTLKDVKISNVSMRCSGTTRSLAGITIGSNGAWTRLVMNNVTLSGNLSSFVYCGSTQAGTGTIQISNSYADGNGNLSQTIVLSTGGRSLNLLLSNVVAPDIGNHAFNVNGGSGKTFDVRMNNVKAGQKIFDFGGSTSHTINVRLSGVSSDLYTPASGNMLTAFGTTCTWNFLGNCLDIGVDLANIARQSGTSIFNTNAALGTLGAAGPVVGQGTAANSWRLMGDPTKQY
jgi:hypothetical protein